MELRRSGRREGGVVAALLCCCTFICFISLFALLGSGHCRNIHLGVRTLRRYSSVQVADCMQEAPALAGRRRELIGGPGSYPPRCMAKCGDCTPCNPVHVAVPPGTPVTTEYYPEAWRCKCGNKLYMP